MTNPKDSAWCRRQGFVPEMRNAGVLAGIFVKDRWKADIRIGCDKKHYRK